MKLLLVHEQGKSIKLVLLFNYSTQNHQISTSTFIVHLGVAIAMLGFKVLSTNRTILFGHAY